MPFLTQGVASLARLSISWQPVRQTPVASIPHFLVPSAPSLQTRSVGSKGKPRRPGAGGSHGRSAPKLKKTRKEFKSYNMSNVEQYSLCDALRYLRAYEVGRPPSSVKYDLALKVKTNKSGPILRNRIRLPHPVQADTRVGVVCAEGSAVAAEALALGAVVVGEDTIFEAVRSGSTLPFNRLICHEGSEAALKKAGLGKELGPRGLMPSLRTGTITRDVPGLMRDLVGAADYRERMGVIRLSVGQIGFTPEMVADNLRALMKQLRSEMDQLEDQNPKAVDEVVISTTNGPSFSLSGNFSPSDESITTEDLAGPM